MILKKKQQPMIHRCWIWFGFPQPPFLCHYLSEPEKIQEKKHTKPPSHGHPWLHNESVAVQLCPRSSNESWQIQSSLEAALHPTMAHRSSSNGDLQHVNQQKIIWSRPKHTVFLIMFNPSVAAENHVSSPYGIDLVISLAGNYPILGALDVPKSDAFPHFPSKN